MNPDLESGFFLTNTEERQMPQAEMKSNQQGPKPREKADLVLFHGCLTRRNETRNAMFKGTVVGGVHFRNPYIDGTRVYTEFYLDPTAPNNTFYRERLHSVDKRPIIPIGHLEMIKADRLIDLDEGPAPNGSQIITFEKMNGRINLAVEEEDEA